MTGSGPPVTGSGSPDSSAGIKGKRILVTGVTGYIGSRLVPQLLEHGAIVRVLTRKASRLAERPWFEEAEVVEGDATSDEVLTRACADVDVAYYLLHSMDGVGDFVERDRELARRFGLAAFKGGVHRIVYLSGLHPPGPLSAHLASREEVGNLLMASGVPTATLQAAMIIGGGSASFEMLRHLTQRLPAMIAPKWLHSRIQPIAIGDTLHYLIAAASLPADVNRAFDIGGPDILTYEEMIREFARITKLRPRRIVTVPVLTPRLASLWVGLVTPVPSGVARPLVGSLVHDVVRSEDDLDDLAGMPPGGLLGFEAAVRAAVADGGTRPTTETTDPALLSVADPDWAGR